MHSYRIFWEDHQRNREVEIFVDYHLQDELVQVTNVRPTRVTLYHAQTQQPHRTLGVYTRAGQQHLAQLHQASRHGLPRIEDEIYSHHNSREEVRV
jgi:hypothetical protein